MSFQMNIWKCFYDRYGVDGDSGHAFDEVEDVAGVVLFGGPLVGVVDDAGYLVGLDLVAIDEPLQRRS